MCPMSLKVITPFFDNIFPEKIQIFVSDNTVDFKLGDGQVNLTDHQKAYLDKNLGASAKNIFYNKQVHGDTIVELKEDFLPLKNLQDADAIVTGLFNFPIAVRTADCLPVFLCDAKKWAIGVVHAGWKGAQLKIVAKTLKRMSEAFGTNPADVKAVFGPCIRSCCYTVGKEFVDVFPSYVSKNKSGLCFNLAAVNRDQLIEAGVSDHNIVDSNVCTCCNSQYFSFRRQKEEAGRMLSVIVMKK